MDVSELLAESFDRLPALVREAAEGLSREQLAWRPAPDANSIGWLLWHLTRVQDHHLAELLGVPLAVIRRWHRRGLIVPAREVRRLPYFDFQEVAAARRLAELLAAGVSPASIEKKLAAVARYLPDVRRPLAQLSVIIEGKDILLRQGDGQIDRDGRGPHAALAADRHDQPRSRAQSVRAGSRGLPHELPQQVCLVIHKSADDK